VEGSFTLKRLAFNIGEGVWKDTDTVADDVIVRFKFALPK
jgi:polyisoprenoid-binding protein YceI